MSDVGCVRYAQCWVGAMWRLGLLVFVLEELTDLGVEIIFVSFLVFLLLPDQPKIISDEIF